MSDELKPAATLHSRPPPVSSPQGLTDRVELAAIALTRTHVPMMVTDPRQTDHPIVLANQAFLDLTGFEADEVVGRNCRFLQGKDTAPDAVAELRAAIAAPRETTVTLLNYRKNGSTFWNKLHISPIHDDSGQLLYFFASQEDVTEFLKVRTLQANEHRLLKEVDHRARNVLAVVNGIVRLTRSDDMAAYASSVQERVQALAAAHTLLADHGWQAVSLEEIVCQQLNLVASDRVSVEGPEVMTPAGMVQPLALVIHELLLNATMHGALSGPDGTLAVRWRIEGANNGFQLVWTESDGPLHMKAAKSGFGTTMTDVTIERQLRGRVRRDWSDRGLRLTLTVPFGLPEAPVMAAW